MTRPLITRNGDQFPLTGVHRKPDGTIEATIGCEHVSIPPDAFKELANAPARRPISLSYTSSYPCANRDPGGVLIAPWSMLQKLGLRWAHIYEPFEPYGRLPADAVLMLLLNDKYNVTDWHSPGEHAVGDYTLTYKKR